ncbi:type II toxin-antitoxin system death-on-curing family toxin [Actinopolymorpha pittospori]|uniref:type II toxin-antitoxin system death-on-curing family toxin n=1 Tax=Actinopolymorpha pittospori TaxID=648752 RepID=UPI0031E5F19D
MRAEDLLRMHEAEVLDGGGVPGVNMGLLEAGVNRCRASAFGEDAFPTFHEKAAALFAGVIQSHAFLDGNKRVAVMALIAFYELNGYQLLVEDIDLVDLALDVIEHRADLAGEDREKIADRLALWACPMDLPEE